MTAVASGHEGQRTACKKRLQEVLAAGQEHVVEDWDALDAAQQQLLARCLEDINLTHLSSSLQRSVEEADRPQAAPEPLHDVTRLQGVSPDQAAAWRQEGLQLVAEGRLGILLLAGGQGTRLGSPDPKGCYNVGLPSRKSLFHLQAERLLRLQTLAAGPGCSVRHPLMWYVMTSPSTEDKTKQHFKEHNFFGLQEQQVFFFRQGELPCFSSDRRVIMAAPGVLATAPDGNGGVYLALARSGALAHMQQQGIACVDCYCVDNALVRPGDPLFVGQCWAQQAECGARVIAKAFPEERVGVFARRGKEVQVVEYSEMDPQAAASRDEGSGQLRFNWSNICMHYFSTAFLARMAQQLVAQGRYHLARKRIPSKDGPVEGFKLELFIFDTFPLAQRIALVEVRREQEFAPVKNAPGAKADTPEAARDAILALHTRWVTTAGGKVAEGVSVEVSPLVSYAGEGLDDRCRGHTFEQPLDKRLQEPQQS